MYSTPDDLKARLEEATLTALCDDDGDNQADSGIIESMVADADAEIDATLGGRYSTPFDPVPSLIRALSAQLAIDALFRRRRETPPPEHAAQAERARALLDRLARGQIRLIGSESIASPRCNRSADDKINKPHILTHY